jgi:hypothetical protein
MISSSSEPTRIADQLRRAFEGDAWHGPALLELLKDVDAASAAAKPLASVHSIWELVLHVAAWDGAACRRLAGEKLQLTGTANFPLVRKPTEAAGEDGRRPSGVSPARARSGQEIRFLPSAARSGAT